ncbi:putative metal-binding protein [Enterovirga sp. CN4-39]|uniref:putative metal-binding protein n=1 Tax=Enterovirga sp. CN4-39 TaxID=3400910 RepID=UPI003C0CE241
MSQVVDPSVSRAKFERELAAYRAAEPTFVARGIWLMHAEFPVMKFAFLAAKLRPAQIVLAARIDFTDYDLHPLSVRFVDPFDDRELAKEQLQSLMRRLDPAAPEELVAAAMAGQAPMPVQELVQGYPGVPAFLCLPGVREYHDNPAHSGDPWFLHRSTGEGDLRNILEKIWRYGSDPITVMTFAISAQLSQQAVPR